MLVNFTFNPTRFTSLKNIKAFNVKRGLQALFDTVKFVWLGSV